MGNMKKENEKKKAKKCQDKENGMKGKEILSANEWLCR